MSTGSDFADIAESVGAYLMVDMAHVAGLIAAGEYPNPVPVADVTTTTTHKTLRGPRGGMILARENEALTKRLNSLVFPGTQGGPLMHVIAAKAVAFLEAQQPDFIDYQRQVKINARHLANALQARDFDIVSGGTDCHLFLVDLIRRDLTGKDADAALDRSHITVNKNSVPNDPRSPFVTSGLRLGTPAITTRGMKEPEIEQIAGHIADVLDNPGDAAAKPAFAMPSYRCVGTSPYMPDRSAGCTALSAAMKRPRSRIPGSLAKAARCVVVVSV